jgi:carboxymethylenebutenolidase
MTAKPWQPTPPQLLAAAWTLAHESIAITFTCKKNIEYQSVGLTIRGSIYSPPGAGPAPAVLVLHTAAGLTAHEHAIAARLARLGYTALVVAYSPRTTGAILKDEAPRSQLEEIISAAWGFLNRHERTAAWRTAVIGYSLGGYFAAYLGGLASGDPPGAVLVYYGMYPLPEVLLARIKAPLLILQGALDSPDFVEQAKHACEELHRLEKPCELVIYPGAGHQFDLFQPGSLASNAAWERTLAFLRQHLGPPEERS